MIFFAFIFNTTNSPVSLSDMAIVTQPNREAGKKSTAHNSILVAQVHVNEMSDASLQQHGDATFRMYPIKQG